jgi:hypothetical protein
MVDSVEFDHVWALLKLLKLVCEDLLSQTIVQSRRKCVAVDLKNLQSKTSYHIVTF